MQKKITEKEFGKMLNSKISPLVAKKIIEAKLVYSAIDSKKRDEIILKIISVLRDDSIPFSGKHRFDQWEKGWGENLNGYLKTQDDKFLVPKYYGKYDIVRVNGDFVRAVSPNFEANMISIIVYWAIDKYLKKVENVFEFGCGPGHNLLKMREVNQRANIWGLDWVKSSQETVKQIALKHKDKKMFAKQFDYSNPDYKFKLPPKSGILTMASLEQTGDNYKKFVDYILKNKPEVVINIEPMAEILDQTRLPDYLSIEYFKKRKYLNGYVNYLRELEKKGKVKIINAQRTNSGSMFVDGHSLVVWKPLQEGL